MGHELGVAQNPCLSFGEPASRRGRMKRTRPAAMRSFQNRWGQKFGGASQKRAMGTDACEPGEAGELKDEPQTDAG